MKTSTLICFLLFLAGVIIGLLQLWFKVWDGETFVKIIITDGALFALYFVWLFLLREQKESRKINGGNGLD